MQKHPLYEQEAMEHGAMGTLGALWNQRRGYHLRGSWPAAPSLAWRSFKAYMQQFEGKIATRFGIH